MARRFSIGEAVGEPFRLAFRRPVTTMAWGLISIVPSLIVFAAMGPMFAEMIESGGLAAAGAQPGAGDFENFDQFMAFQAWSGLSQLLSLLALVMITTAIARAVIRGSRRDGWAFLRLSKDEFHVAVIGIAIFIGVVVVIALGAVVIAGFGIGAASTGAEWAAVTAVGWVSPWRSRSLWFGGAWPCWLRPPSSPEIWRLREGGAPGAAKRCVCSC